jgi:hypothetical protein
MGSILSVSTDLLHYLCGKSVHCLLHLNGQSREIILYVGTDLLHHLCGQRVHCLLHVKGQSREIILCVGTDLLHHLNVHHMVLTPSPLSAVKAGKNHLNKSNIPSSPLG